MSKNANRYRKAEKLKIGSTPGKITRTAKIAIQVKNIKIKSR